jgi:hypothetical protein
MPALYINKGTVEFIIVQAAIYLNALSPLVSSLDNITKPAFL